jgi:hypothetical protein
MCKGTWVCFLCRVAVRRDTWRLVPHVHPELVGSKGAGKVRFPQCGKASVFLGPSISIPPKRDVRGWSRLENDVRGLQSELITQSKRISAERKHATERRIRDLEGRDGGTGREVLIKALKKELKEPNQTLEPTPTAVTFRACARPAPAAGVAHL